MLLSTTAAAFGSSPFAAMGADDVVKALVGFPPGGAIDTTARAFGRAMTSVGTVVVENHPGAAGNIAAGLLAQSRPDGRTLMFAPVNVYCISQALYRNLAFDAVRDFAPVGITATFPWSLAVHPSVPAHSLSEFVAWLKANPQKALCGMAAIGSEGHLMAYAFSKEAGIPLQFVPYKGGAPMAQDLMAGQILMAFDPIVNMGPPHRAGKVRILAVTGRQRAASLPEVPTFSELGFPAITGQTWIGVAARKGTPSETIQSYSSALIAAANEPSLRERLALVGLTAVAGTPDEMGAQMAADTARYGKLARELGLRLD
ncbi:MAG TPA: tripartite tricarboxylate transporter substrate binding protein [Caldimonas sp.]|nr:tripartite tricarboxylate transporter substrate binding protein [Caldimonas sp.]